MGTLTDDLAEQLAHCDGMDCACMAHYAGECGCDVDWTPAEVYRLRAEIMRNAEDAARTYKDPTGFSSAGVSDEAEHWTARSTGKEMLQNYAKFLASEGR